MKGTITLTMMVLGFLMVAGMLTGMNLYYAALGSQYNTTVPNYAFNDTASVTSLSNTLYSQVNTSTAFVPTDLVGWMWMGGAALSSLIGVGNNMVSYFGYVSGYFGIPYWFVVMVSGMAIFIVIILVIKLVFKGGEGAI